MNKKTAASIESLDKHQLGRFIEVILTRFTDNEVMGIIGAIGETKPSDLEGEEAVIHVVDALYPMWRAAVKSKEITQAKASAQKLIWKHKNNGLPKLTAREEIRVWESWQAKGHADGLLIRNIKYAPGKRIPEYLVK